MLTRSVRRLFALFLVPAALACSGAQPTADSPTSGEHAIDPSAIDASVKPGTDFFLFANGAWYKKAQIPADRVFTGNDLKLVEEAEQRTRALLEEASKASAPAGSTLQRVGDAYAS